MNAHSRNRKQKSSFQQQKERLQLQILQEDLKTKKLANQREKAKVDILRAKASRARSDDLAHTIKVFGRGNRPNQHH